VIYYSSGGGVNFSPGSSSAKDWKAAGSCSTVYSFTYYDAALKINRKNISGDATINSSELESGYDIYSYSGAPGDLYTFAEPAFTPLKEVTIYLINGSLLINSEFSIPATYSIIFIIKNNLIIGGELDANPADPDRIPGLYIVGDTFTVESGAGQFILDGMLYARVFDLHRSFRNPATPTYQFIYQPKYLIDLLPYIGRSEVTWKEIGP